MDKSKFFTATVLCAVLSIPTVSHAAIISYGSYTHDTNTDIVTGNGLEWLQWDMTLGMSMNEGYSVFGTIEGGGWSIASNSQMASLFNNFNFGIMWDSNENTDQIVSTGYGPGRGIGSVPYSTFVSMLGDTYAADGVEGSYAVFGQDLDNDGLINNASVEASRSFSCGNNQLDANARMSFDIRGQNSIQTCYGVALVRPVSSVPIPSAVWLFGSGLIGLAGLARRKA